ncbi:immunity protein YezG family protein [Bacillus atrophaeus]|uniref:immunity protein YezG family protein n=1 Tax=Bacillus atrophaeus TaxID=1452 RepID=UPI0022817C7C|nr:immunity protein YezG family protein [Bacillus atrophaeus]MCY8467309.1 antitoxin YezG family protein [Bacillus atrophaeus]MCY8479929.1 antitoxin YezG family protein [Bacillus atrophaeus]
MDENKLNTLYQKIAETVVETIPEEWSKVFIYGEILEDVQKGFFYYYPEGNESPVYCHDIPEIFEIEKEDYRNLWRQLIDNLKELWNEFKESDQETWTSLTMMIQSDGAFNINYDYEDLSDADDYERRIVWEHKHLGLWPDDGEDKEFLEQYLESNKDEK